MTTLQRRLAAFTAVAVAVTRIWARSRTLWDWDETLFALGVRSYDVTQHHPHPPGFPLYVATAKFVRLFVHSDFHALQAINILAAISLFPLLMWLALELRFPFRTAYLGSLLFVFLPNVWFFGGTAFSDIPALALLIAACATLLRGARSSRAYFAGALLLGLAAAMRPQALLIGCAPALYASWQRRRVRDLVIASAIGLTVIVIAYGGAALASNSVAGYFETTHYLREYVRNVDSFMNPARQPVLSLFPNFFLRAIPGGHITVALSALALISVIVSLWRRHSCLRAPDREECLSRLPLVWMLVAMFLPFNVMGWFMLDVNSISRYSIGYAPMYAILAADALSAITALQAIVVLAAIARFIWWTLPALHEVRHTASPTAAAMEWIRGNVPKSRPVYVHGSMGPFASYFIADYNVVPVDDTGLPPIQAFRSRDWFVTEGGLGAADEHIFVRKRGNLFDIVRRRYFEVSVTPLQELGRFGAGWYDAEGVGAARWRWMGGRSETLLPPISGNARLTLAFNLPTELVPRHPTVAIYLNGTLVDRMVCTTPSASRILIVPSRGDAWNTLVISMDKVLNPAKEGILPDARDLGLQLTSYGWQPSG